MYVEGLAGREAGLDRVEHAVQRGAEAVDRCDDGDAIPAAINPYSMAVAPDSSFQKFPTNAFIAFCLVFRYRSKGNPPPSYPCNYGEKPKVG